MAARHINHFQLPVFRKLAFQLPRLVLSVVLVNGPVIGAEAWTPELQLKVKAISEVMPSHDGKRSAWIESNPAESRLMVDGVEVPGWTAQANSLAWSADGKYLYFASGAAAYRSAVGSSPGAAERISRHPGTMGGLKFAPDVTKFAFLERVGKTPASRIRLAGVPQYTQRICVSKSDGTGETLCPVEPRGYVGALTWSPDSTRVAFELRPTPFPDDGRLSDIFEADLATGMLEAVAKTGASETSPIYSPDGRFLVYLRSEDPPLQPGDNRMMLWDRVGRKVRELALTDDRLPTLIGWSADSRRIYYSEARGTRNVISAMPLDGAPQLVFAPDGVTAGERLNASGTFFGFAMESAGKAPEAHVFSEGAKPVPVSKANAAFANVETARTEVVWWRSRGNVEVEGLLTYPAGYQEGRKYPMVVVLHGGPYGRFDESFIGRGGLYPVASFAARGYAVFRPNPRASTGYGRDFRYLNLKDWGGGDFDDVMTGVRAQALADPERLAVMGWSYGGFLTSWTISHSAIFKAACIGAGVSNLWSQTGTSDIRSNKLDAFGAPWENQAFYIERSPLTHVKNVRTPVMILGGEADERVPISQSYELFHALKRLGVETEMVVYPGAGHSPREPEYVLDIMKRHLNWTERFLSAGSR